MLVERAEKDAAVTTACNHQLISAKIRPIFLQLKQVIGTEGTYNINDLNEFIGRQGINTNPGCTCRGDCASKRCSCNKGNSKCTAACACAKDNCKNFVDAPLCVVIPPLSQQVQYECAILECNEHATRDCDVEECRRRVCDFHSLNGHTSHSNGHILKSVANTSVTTTDVAHGAVQYPRINKKGKEKSKRQLTSSRRHGIISIIGNYLLFNYALHI